MLAAAIADRLRAGGLSPVREDSLGDYAPGAGPVWAVSVEHDAEIPRLGKAVPWYAARLQLRARGDDKRAAIRAGDRALDIALALAGQTVQWTDSADGRVYRYRMVAVDPRNRRPNWYPTRTGGETVTMNFDLQIQEAP